MSQHQVVLLLAVILVVAVIAIAIFLLQQKLRSEKLRQRFGPEYDRVVKQEGNIRRGEAVLEFHTKRREKLQIHPLSASMRADFAERWRTVQAQFVDDPKNAVARADQLVNQVMQTRGYPMQEFEEQTGLIAVDHPIVVDNYRSAHEIAARHSRGQASTEDLRQAVVHYRALFDELLEEPNLQRKEA
jgi:hypothetical protein